MRHLSSAKGLGLLLLTAAALGFLSLGLAWPSYQLVSSSRAIEAALLGAQSVSVQEFIDYRGTSPQVLQSVILSAGQISRFRSATGGFLEIGFPPLQKACFTPHHRVEIVRADGSPFRFEVCFHCDNFSFNGRGTYNLPSGWRTRLEQFFA